MMSSREGVIQVKQLTRLEEFTYMAHDGTMLWITWIQASFPGN